MAAYVGKTITRCVAYKKTLVATILLVFITFSMEHGHAAVSTSITSTTGTGNLGTNVAQSGNLYNITGGTRPGGGPNLFHSFGNFSVGPGDIANFQNTMVNGSFPLTSNILGRVTGGNISNIFGTIQTTNFGNANLFLMNPAGFLFGPNATVNVGSMMTFTTADYMRLADNGRFNANPNATPPDVLTTAPIAAFGFLGSNPAAISFEGGQLNIAAGTGLGLVGGNINLLSDSSGTPSSITAHGRSIQVTSVGGAGEVAADTGIPVSGMALGTITLSQGSVLDTTGDPSFRDGSGGVISIRGGQFFASGTNITTSPASGTPGQGGAVTIMASDTASIAEGSFITTSSASPNSNAGPVTIHGSHVILQDSVIFTEYLGDGTTAGNGGDVIFNGTEKVEIIRSGIATDFSNTTGGKGGAVSVTAPIITLEDSLLLTGNAFQPSFITSGGSAGAVTLAGESSVSLTRSGIDTSTTATTGNSGTISITAPTITIADVGPTFFSLDASTRSFEIPNAGNGGNIFIDGTNVTITNFATIQSLAESNGSFSKGGNIQINGKDLISLDSGAFIRTITTSQAQAGDIQLTGNHVTITGQSTVSTDTIGPGGGGTIKISGIESIDLKSGSLISTNTDPALGTEGPAGHIELNTQQLTITDGTIVRSQGVGIGPSGTVTVQGISGPAQSVLIDGSGSGIFTDTQGSGAGGNIFVNANTVTLSNGGTLSAKTSGTEASATGGTITVNANQVQLNNQAQVTATSSGAGNAGTITLTAAESIDLLGNSSVTSNAESAGNGGLVSLTAPSIELHGNSNIGTNTGGLGNAGNIQLQANQVSLTESFVTARTQAEGQGGNISIQGLTGEGSHASEVTLFKNSQLVTETIGDGVNIQGLAGNIRIDTARLNLSGASLINTASRGSTSSAGNITVNATDSVTISDPGTQLFSGSTEFSFGDAGHIAISAPSVIVDNGGGISTITGLVGNAGTITVHTNNLQLLSGGHITSSSVAEFPDIPPSGAAGTVTIQGLASPAQTVLIDGAGSGIFTNTEGTGAGGNIFVNANSVTLHNRSHISSSSTGSGTAGDITINAGSQFTMMNSSVTTEANHSSGGEIKITTNPNGTVQLTDSTISASVLDGTGGGGSVNIDPQFVILQNSQILANSVFGPGGNISITTNLLLPDSASVISASSQFGQQGTIIIQSPISPASGKIVPLGQKPLLPTSLLSQRCAALAGGTISSFTVAGRDSLPAEPGGWLSNPLALSSVREDKVLEARSERETSLLSLRQVAPPGFLTQTFAVDSSGCTS